MTEKIKNIKNITTVEEWLGKENQIGIDIWKKKYRKGNETFLEWISRISGGDEKIARFILEKKFLFGGRIMANRKRKETLADLMNQPADSRLWMNTDNDEATRKITYSNCYVICPPEDNLESIFDCAKKLARTYSYGGGCGIDISQLAPRGAKINNAAKETSGAVSFMDLYSMVTGLIGQNGRRGALMLSISCDHPDVEEFIEIKSDLNKITKANISVRITTEFMEAVRNREMFTLSFTRKETGETITKEVDAYKLFHKLCEMNWDYAEPGILFWDQISNWNLMGNTKGFYYAGVNPCAEEPLPAGGSCLLGSINLSEFVIDPFQESSSFDYKELEECVRAAVFALNEVMEEGIDLHPLKEQRESVRKWKQIGLGIMGLADTFLKLGITYGDSISLSISEMIGRTMVNAAMQASAEIAKEKGCFEDFNKDEVMRTSFFRYVANEDTAKKVSEYGLRNSQLMTIAPTGSISTMLGISGGIEPIYANVYERKTESLHGKDVYYKVYTKIVKDYIATHGLKDISELPKYFVTAMDLDYKDRLKMQSSWQKYIDASISSTVNVPNNFTVKDVENLYMEAYDLGLKGVTIFRDGCKRAGILSTKDGKEKEEKKTKVQNEEKVAVSAADESLPTALKRGEIEMATDDEIGKKRKLTTGCGSLHCIAFFKPTGELVEIFLNKGSSGGCNNFMNSLSRFISLSARAGVSIESIVDQLGSCGTCPSYASRSATKKDTSKGASCPTAVGYALMDMYREMQEEVSHGRYKDTDGISETQKAPEQPMPKKPEKSEPKRFEDEGLCPECGEPLVFEGGCNVCKSCGWSKCF